MNKATRNHKNDNHKSPPPPLTVPKQEVMDPALHDLLLTGHTGFEGMTAQDMMVPRIGILQALSPQLQPNRPEYIPDAKQGQFCDLVSGEVYENLIIIPCVFRHTYLEWFPRSTGKGLAKNHGTHKPVPDNMPRDEHMRWVLANGNYVQDAAEFYVLNFSAHNKRCLISLTSTAWKAAKRWNDRLASVMIDEPGVPPNTPAPMYYKSWVAGVRTASNAEGTWYTWDFAPSLKVSAMEGGGWPLVKAAKEFGALAAKGLLEQYITRQEDINDDADDKPF